MKDRVGLMRGKTIRTRWVAAIGLVGVLIGGGIAYATVPNSGSGQISVCYPTSGAAAGQMRVIDYQAGHRCKAGEKMLSWQQRGVRYRGAWKSTVLYSVDDVVVSAGSAYVAVGASTNVPPPNAVKWAVFAAKGATGAPAPRPSNVIWVAPSGGNFTSVKAALASITNNGSAHRYVVKVAPGTYTESGGIALKDYVDIEGSGQDTTVITCACGNAASPAFGGQSATLRATGPNLHSEVRQITIKNTGPNIYSTAIWTGGVVADTVAFTGVTALASGGTGDYAIWNAASSPSMKDVVATSAGSGAGSTESFAVTIDRSDYDYNSGFAMDRVVATATGAQTTIGVRLTTNQNNPLRITGVDATAQGIDFPNAVSHGFFIFSSNESMTNITAESSFANISAVSAGVFITGTASSVQITNSYFEGGLSAAQVASGNLVAISRSTLNGGVYGAGGKICAFNVDGGGTAIGAPGC
jgi:hypothetical protein